MTFRNGKGYISKPSDKHDALINNNSQKRKTNWVTAFEQSNQSQCQFQKYHLTQGHSPNIKLYIKITSQRQNKNKIAIKDKTFQFKCHLTTIWLDATRTNKCTFMTQDVMKLKQLSKRTL